MPIPAKKISFKMPARQAYIVLDWLGYAIKATPFDDPASQAIRLLQSQLRSALRAEVGTPALQRELFEPKSLKAVKLPAKRAKKP